jgi:predicted negative regulator of RcsB-dependent stress response
VFSEFVDRSGGRIFNTAGDAILAEFQSAVEAVRCAVDIQESLRARNVAYPASRHMSFRIGITIGDVVERENGDLLGDGVNVAARLESVAPPGGVCVSRSVHEAVAGKMTIRFADAGQQSLKNMPERVHAYTIALGDPEVAPRAARKRELPKLPPIAPIVDGARAQATTLISLARAHTVTAALLVLAVAMTGVYAYRFLPGIGGSGPESAKPAAVAAAKPNAPMFPEPVPESAAVQESTAVAEAAPETPTESPVQPGTAPPAHAAAVPETAQEPAPAPSRPAPVTSPLATRYVLARQWADCHENGNADVALSACKALLDNGGLDDEDKASVRYKYGRALRDKGDPDKAIESYDQSIALHPTADAYNHRGIAYFDKGDYRRAIADYTEAMRLDPSDAEAVNNRAWTSYKAGDIAGALRDADKAVALDGTKAYIWDTRGHINEAKGNRAAAINDYRKALTLDASSQGSSDGLRRLGAAN